jgi:hypothetical protein
MCIADFRALTTVFVDCLKYKFWTAKGSIIMKITSTRYLCAVTDRFRKIINSVRPAKKIPSQTIMLLFGLNFTQKQFY